MFAMLAGQVWTAERAGGTPLRDALASCYVHRIKRRQANMLLQLGDELPETLTLATGTAYLYRTSGELQPVSIPFTSGADVEHVAGLLGGAETPQGHQEVTKTDTEPTALLSAEPPSAEAARILALFRTGNDVADIVRELWPDVGKGASYQRKSAEVQALLRKHV